jgi:hypothetical protein
VSRLRYTLLPFCWERAGRLGRWSELGGGRETRRLWCGFLPAALGLLGRGIRVSFTCRKGVTLQPPSPPGVLVTAITTGFDEGYLATTDPSSLSFFSYRRRVKGTAGVVVMVVSALEPPLSPPGDALPPPPLALMM